MRELIIDRSKVFYDPNTDFHHHIYNVDTGEIQDISADSLSVTGLPELPSGVQLEGADVVIRVRSKTGRKCRFCLEACNKLTGYLLGVYLQALSFQLI